jgi:hypothetical protein
LLYRFHGPELFQVDLYEDDLGIDPQISEVYEVDSEFN